MIDNNRRRAFTIVELVIVIAVIAILAAVLIPIFAGIIESAQDSKALQNAQTAYIEYLLSQVEEGAVSDYHIYESKDSRIVALRRGEGLDVYDSADDAIKALVDDPDTPENESDNYITALVSEGAGGFLYAVIEKEEQSGNDNDNENNNDNGNDDGNSDQSATAQITSVTFKGGCRVFDPMIGDYGNDIYVYAVGVPLTVTVDGVNLDNATTDNYVTIKSGTHEYVMPEYGWRVSEDGCRATRTFDNSYFEPLTSSFMASYSNGADSTELCYVTYVDNSESEDTVITGVDIIGTDYDESSSTHTIVCGTPLTINVKGKNIDKYNPPCSFFIGQVIMLELAYEGVWSVSSDGTSASIDAGSWFYSVLKYEIDNDGDGVVDEVIELDGDGEISIYVGDLRIDTGVYVDFVDVAE